MKSYLLIALLICCTGSGFRPVPTAPYYYYVSAYCFCSPNTADSREALHLFISATNRGEGSRYNDEKIRARFQEQLKLEYDKWFNIGTGSISVRMFASEEDANDARRADMARKKNDGYQLHAVNP